MLSHELMALGALAILWVNTLLVIGAAWIELSRIRARNAAFSPLPKGAEGAFLIHGRVTSGRGPKGAFAERTIDQVGRVAADDHGRPAILFADRHYESALFGGTIELADGATCEVGEGPCEAWIDAAKVAEAARCPSDATFDEAHGAARKARGYGRLVRARVAEGDEVWIHGDVSRSDDGSLRIAEPRGSALVVATTDPRGFCGGAALKLWGLIAGALIAASICTLVALTPPIFGLVSTIGGALGLAYFLIVQPAGTAVRDAVRLPHLAIVRGSWVRGEPTKRAASLAQQAP